MQDKQEINRPKNEEKKMTSNKNQQIKITNSHDSVVIDIEGTIGVPESWQFEDPQQRIATYEKFRETVQHIEDIAASRVVVNIRSTGGDVNDAMLIYEALTSLDAAITTRCWGYVASAATVIAQAASDGQREISPNALYLIHNSTCSADGNAAEMEQRAELLRKSDERIAELYARRAGVATENFRELMAEQNGEGRWLNAKETIEMGLADCEIDPNSVAQRAPNEQQELEAAERSDKEQTTVAEKIANALSSVKAVIAKVGKRLSADEEEETEEQELLEEEILEPLAEEGEEIQEQELLEEEILEPLAEEGEEIQEQESAQEEEENLEEIPQEQEQLEEEIVEEEQEQEQEQEETKERKTKAKKPEVKNAAPTKMQRSLIALEQGQKSLKRSEVEATNDPSLTDITRSDNDTAYERDARRMRGAV